MSDLIERLREEPYPYEKRHGLGITAMEVWHKTACEAADEIERLREELNVTRLQRDAKLSSQTAVDEAAAREIERLRHEIDVQCSSEYVERILKENERLRAELNTLAEGNVERWERECADAAEIKRLRAALKRIANDRGGHPDSGEPLRDIARETLNKGEEK